MSQQVGVKIKHIKDPSFFVKEEYFRKDTEVQISLQYKIGFDVEKKLINVLVYITCFYNKPEVVVAEIQVMNIFELSSFNGLLADDGTISLPETLMATIIPLSVTHARALLSKNLAGSAYSDVVLPLMSIDDLLVHFSSLKQIKQQ